MIVFSGLCAALSLTILYWTGGQMNLTMVMLPTLTFILGVSGCVHMVNYYRKASTLGCGMNSADQAIVDGWLSNRPFRSDHGGRVVFAGHQSCDPDPVVWFLFRLRHYREHCRACSWCLPATLYLMRGRISKRFSERGKMSKRERATGVSRSTSLLAPLGLPLALVGRHSGTDRRHALVASACLS